MPSLSYTMPLIVTKSNRKDIRLYPPDISSLSTAIRKLIIKSALTEMSHKFDELKKRWDANEAELVNAFKILGYGKE